MSLVGRKHGKGADDAIAEARAFLGPVRAQQRAAQIAALPTVNWADKRGRTRTLYTLRCRGTSGRGPHDVNVPLALCWHLLSLDRFFCVYHAGDALGDQPLALPAAQGDGEAA